MPFHTYSIATFKLCQNPVSSQGMCNVRFSLTSGGRVLTHTDTHSWRAQGERAQQRVGDGETEICKALEAPAYPRKCCNRIDTSSTGLIMLSRSEPFQDDEAAATANENRNLLSVGTLQSAIGARAFWLSDVLHRQHTTRRASDSRRC